MVVGARLVGIRVSSRCDSPGPNVLVRLLGRGLGSTLSGHRRFRPLVTNRSSSVHQSQRTNSSQVGAEALSPSFTGSGCRGFLCQFNHGSLPEEAGGEQCFLSSIKRLRPILRWTEEHQITLVPQFILGHHNVLANSLSRRVAEQASFAKRSSTRLVYRAIWYIFRRWCRDHGHSVSRPTLPSIADFILLLHE